LKCLYQILKQRFELFLIVVRQKARAKAVNALNIIPESKELAESQVDVAVSISLSVPPPGCSTVVPKPTE